MSSIATGRMIDDNSDPVKGRVVWMPAKSIWIATMTLIAVIGGPLTFTWSALGVFILLTAVTICLGHSVGMHRLLIHRSFSTHIWIEHFLVYLGTLVGMAGPFGMIYAHDIRDWAQRQPGCMISLPIGGLSSSMPSGRCIARWCCTIRHVSSSRSGNGATASIASWRRHGWRNRFPCWSYSSRSADCHGRSGVLPCGYRCR